MRDTEALSQAVADESVRKDRTVLVVEDDDVIRAMVHRTLTREGYIVVLASSGLEAIEILKTSDSDIGLLITDILMPQMDGQTLAEQVRVLQPSIKVLFMSGYASDVLDRKSEVQADAPMLNKPFSIFELRALVSRLLPD